MALVIKSHLLTGCKPITYNIVAYVENVNLKRFHASDLIGRKSTCDVVTSTAKLVLPKCLLRYMYYSYINTLTGTSWL